MQKISAHFKQLQRKWRRLKNSVSPEEWEASQRADLQRHRDALQRHRDALTREDLIRRRILPLAEFHIRGSQEFSQSKFPELVASPLREWFLEEARAAKKTEQPKRKRTAKPKAARTKKQVPKRKPPHPSR